MWRCTGQWEQRRVSQKYCATIFEIASLHHNDVFIFELCHVASRLLVFMSSRLAVLHARECILETYVISQNRKWGNNLKFAPTQEFSILYGGWRTTSVMISVRSDLTVKFSMLTISESEVFKSTFIETLAVPVISQTLRSVHLDHVPYQKNVERLNSIKISVELQN